MKKTLKILSWICAVVLIFGTVSVGMTAYAGSDDVIGSYDFEITNVYKYIDWSNVGIYKGATHVHTVRSDADTEINDMIHYYYDDFGYDAMSLTDHGTVNYGWNHEQSRVVLYDYQWFVHGDMDEISDSDFKAMITGTRNSRGYGMMDIPLGIEWNGASTKKYHVNGYYADAGHGDLSILDNQEDAILGAIKGNYNAGGFSHVNHVGEWSGGNDDKEVYSTSWVRDFASYFQRYCPNKGGRNAPNQGTRGVIGMELVNTADSRTRNDRRWVYDEILKILAPQGINVFGFCEDDAHEKSDCDRNAQYFLINKNKDVKITSSLFDASNKNSDKTSDYENNNSDPMDKVQNYYREAMFYGEFYASSKNSKNSYELGDGFVAKGNYPSISNISVDNAKDQISVTFKDATKVRLVADGNIIETAKTSASTSTVVFDLNKYETQINSYVRIYLTGAGGITYLQPFLVTKSASTESTVQFVSPDTDDKGNYLSLTSDIEVVVKDSNESVVDSSVTFTNNFYKLQPGTYTYTASRRGYITKTEEFTVTQADIDNAEQVKIPIILEENSDVTYAYFYAPETIYVTPNDNLTFDKYVDRENAVNGAIHTTLQNQGNIFFKREGATDLRLSYNIIEGSDLPSSLVVGSTDIKQAGEISFSGDTISTSVTSGTLTRALTGDEYDVIKWTAKYKLNGIEYESNAYSYVYRTPSGASNTLAAGARVQTTGGFFLGWSHSTMFVLASIYASGINKLEHVYTPDVTYTGYKFAPNSGFAFTAGTDSVTTTGSGYTYSEIKSDGGSEKKKIKNNDIGYIYVDRSRINDWSQIPYLKLGFDLNNVDETTGEDGDGGSYGVARFIFDTTLTGAWDGTYHPDDVLFSLLFADNKSNYTQITDYNLSDDSVTRVNGSVDNALESYGSKRLYLADNTNSATALTKSLPSASAGEVTVPLGAYVKGTKESRRDEIGLEIDLCLVNVDKSGLRTELNNTIKEQFQHDWFRTDDEYDNYQNTIKDAAKVLGDPLSTQDEIDEAKEELMAVYDNFQLKTGTMTVKYYWRLPDGTEGLINDEGTIEYEYGQDLAANAKDITGYTYANSFVCYSQEGLGAPLEIDRGEADFDLQFAEADHYEWRFYYTPSTHTVTYKPNGAEIYDSDGNVTGTVADSTDSVYFEQPYSIPSDILSRTGYTFDGWYLDIMNKIYFPGTDSATFKWNMNSDGEFSAQWTPNDYNITYYDDTIDNGGKPFTVETAYRKATYGTSYSLTDKMPYKAGYNFAGWNLNNETTIDEETGEEVLSVHTSGTRMNWITASDSSFYATWEIADYKVNFEKNADDAVLTYNGEEMGDSEDDVILVRYNEPYGTLPTATRDGYTVEWYSDPNFQKSAKVDAQTVVTIDEDHTLYAKWIPIDYTITYNLNGGSVGGANPTTYNIESGAITLYDPVKTGYVFSGWTGTDLSTPVAGYTIPAGSTGDKVFNANWELSGYNITYNLDGGKNDINNPATYMVTDDPITLLPPTKDGYRFKGWTGSNGTTPETSVTITTGSTGDKTYNANWDLITYTITYDYNGVTDPEVNPTTYSIESDTFTLVNPERFGYTFGGWECSDEDLSGETVTITNGEVTGDLEFKAIWYKNGSHHINYVLNGGKVEGSNPTDYEDGDAFTITNPTREGYTFAGWTKTVNGATEAATTEAKVLATDNKDIIFTATWNVVDYSISYEGIDGAAIAGTNPTSYNAESADITLSNPSKTGYEFKGWTGTGLTNAVKTVVIETGSTGDRSYRAIWSPEVYEIKYNLNGGTAGSNPTTYTVETGAITLNTPVKTGYTFLGWTGTDISEATVSYTIPAGSTGTKEFTANWSLIGYEINYELNGGTFSGSENPNPSNYTYDSADITLVNPTKAGYNFTGWEYNGTTTTKAVIKQHSTGNRTYTAIFELAEYTITYDGLTGATIADNPTTYNVNSDAFTLNNPTKTGYTFNGWRGTGISGISKNVTVAAGSTGNRTYTAMWSVDTYNIVYHGVEGATVSNPSTYTFETATFTLKNPARTGAVFTGWSGTEIDGFASSVTVATGSTGNREYTANWTYNDYTISYELNGGTLAVENPAAYTLTSAEITLNNPTKTGYTFTGWTGTGLESSSKDVRIPTGSTGHRSYTANWQADNYRITYDLAGGQIADNANPAIYNIETPTIVLQNPTKPGSTFLGWTGTDLTEPTLEVRIPKGSMLPRSYTANWSEVSYSISYSGIDGATFAGDNPTSYTLNSSTITLINPTKRGYHFDGWSGTDISGSGISTSVTIPSGSTGNRSYTANWSLENYTITYELDGGTEGGIKNVTSYNINTAPFSLYAPVKTGYKFAGWIGSFYDGTEASVTVDPSEITGNLTFRAVWEDGEYTITLDPKGGTLPSGQAETFTYKSSDATFTIQNPTRSGYDFAGWTGTGIDGMVETLTIESGSTGNKEYTAVWVSGSENNITYNLGGGEVLNGENPTSYVTGSGDIIIVKPTKAGYNFAGWTVSQDSNSIIEPSTGGKNVIVHTNGGSAVLTAKWTPTSYTIKYNLNGGAVSGTNPAKYTIETPAFTLINPVRAGYTFGGWIGTDLDESKANTNVSISGKTGNRTYTAVWSEESYTITYDYNGGSTSDPNPTSYSVVTPSFTLNNPVKAGYAFTGWTGSNGTTPQKTVTVSSGSTGAKSFTANFSLMSYTIKYHGVDKATETYTVEDTPVTIANPEKLGYEFLGWLYDGVVNPVKNLVFAQGTTGNKELTAQWKENEYTITYNLDGGSVSTPNPETYNIESATIILANPTKAGYVFTGWTGTDIEDIATTVTIAKGSTGNREYTAVWDTAPYTISYSGLLKDAVSDLGLPTTYTTSVAKPIPNPVKPGYTFAGWTGTDLTEPTFNLVIPKGSTGNKTYKATWNINNYSIDLDCDGGELTSTVPTLYTVESDDIVIPTPKKDGFSFTGWTGTNLTAPTKNVVIAGGSVGDIAYKATWTERTNTTHKFYFRGYADRPLYVDLVMENGKVKEHRDYIEVDVGEPITDAINPLVLHPEKIDVTAGYEITGWDINFNADKYINDYDDIIVHAKCEVGSDTYTVIANGSKTTTAKYGQFEKATVTTDYANGSGALFCYWIAKEVDDNGNVIGGEEIASYYRNYSFFVHANVVLTAVYGTPSGVRASTRISTIEPYDPNYDWFTPNSERSIGTELTLTQHGIIFTSDETIGSSEASLTLGKDGVYAGVCKNNLNLTGTWGLSICNPYMLGKDATVYIRSYVKVADEDGNLTTIYSKIRTYINNEDITPDQKEKG